MNKNELTKRIAETTPLNQKEAASAIDAFIDISNNIFDFWNIFKVQ